MTIIADPSAPGAKKSWNEGDYVWDETKAAAGYPEGELVIT